MTCRYALAGLLLLVLAGVMAARTASAGGTVRSVALAQQPHAVVVDTRTSRALVTSYGADRRSGVVSVLDTTTAKAGHEYSRAACERVAAMTERQAVQAFDAVYCLGDIGGDASQPNAVQDLIRI